MVKLGLSYRESVAASNKQNFTCMEHAKKVLSAVFDVTSEIMKLAIHRSDRAGLKG
jgi:hypothetical protein